MRWTNWIKMTIVLLAVGILMGACQGDAPTAPSSAPDATEPIASEAPRRGDPGER